MANEYYANVSGAASCSSSRWLTEEVFKLIDMVQRDEAIYNPRHKYYFCRPYVENFWREVDQKLEKNPGASLAKWTNLRISFRREYTNYLEEKVPPCWSYFDRMFFLHPYLRKKHPQPKSLDSQVQDALVRISSLSDRIHCTAALSGGGAGGTSNNVAHVHLQSQAPQHQQQLDNYLEYFDDPEQNNSELDDIMEEEHQSRFQNAEHHSLNNDIKSECDDQVDDYEPESVANRHHDHDDHDDNDEGDDTEMRSFMLDTLASSSSSVSAHTLQERRNQLRVKHMNRLQTRSYHEEWRAKRPRSQESISSTQMGNGSVSGGSGSGGGCSGNSVAATVSGHARMLCHTSTTPTHTNVSFVRPTLAKPVEMVSTTTNSNGGNGNSHVNDMELNASSTSGQQVAATSSIHQHQHQRHAVSHHSHHSSGNGGGHHRLEIAAISSGSSGVGSASTGTAGTALNGSTTSASANAAHVELCDCKTDPDAMFLMSLLPDIQKLNGRDRGKIKIAFQNILQDYLYPD